MRILTNPGANLPPVLIERYDIVMTSSTIVVDGETHDTRDAVSLQQVDDWIALANEHPYVLGTSAAEFVGHLVSMSKTQPDLLVVMSSSKIIPSYDAAISAIRTLEASKSADTGRMRVLDSRSTDLGLGLLVVAAAELAQAGRNLDETVDSLEAMVQRGRFAVVPRTLENLVRGGKASFLRGWMANMLGVRPLLGFVDGEVQAVDKCSTRDDHPEVLADWFARNVPGRRVWVGVSHGGVPVDAERLLELLRQRFEVVYAIVRPTSPTVYLHAGPGALGAMVCPLDDLPFVPPTPG